MCRSMLLLWQVDQSCHWEVCSWDWRPTEIRYEEKWPMDRKDLLDIGMLFGPDGSVEKGLQETSKVGEYDQSIVEGICSRRSWWRHCRMAADSAEKTVY